MPIFISKNEHPQLWIAIRVFVVFLTALLDAAAFMVWGTYPKKARPWQKDNT